MFLQNIFQELPDEHAPELRGNPLNEPHGKHLSEPLVGVRRAQRSLSSVVGVPGGATPRNHVPGIAERHPGGLDGHFTFSLRGG